MLIQIEPAIRPTWAARSADHQTQHAVAPAADPVLIGLGQQVIDCIDPFGVDLPQRLLGKVVTGIEKREGLAASVLGRWRPAEVFLVIAIQRGATAGVARVEEEILHVDRDELFRAGDLVQIRAAGDLPIVLFALTATTDVLLPTSEVEQARIIAEGEAPTILAPAFVGNADQPGAVEASGAALDQRALGVRPQACTVVNVGDFMQHRGEQFLAHSAVGAIGFFFGRAAVGEAREQFAIQIEFGNQRGLAIGVAGHVIGPADIDAPIQPLDKARRQLLHRLIDQRLAGLLLGGAQTVGLEPQLQAGVGAVAK
jgi:hypothetical protein